MIDELKQQMLDYKIMNEGELFCTTLSFNLDDDKNSKIIGDPGKKTEDAVLALNKNLQEIIDKYKNRFEKLWTKLNCSPRHLAQAVYFATYFNIRNPQYEYYVGRFWLTRDDFESPEI